MRLVACAKAKHIPNYPLQSFIQDFGPAFHTTHVCVNLIRELRNLQFNVDSERQIFEKPFYLLQSFFRKSVEQKSPKKYFHFNI